MKKSKFQFSNPRLRKIEFIVNSTYESKTEESIEISIEMNVEVNKVDGENRAIVELIVRIGNKDNNPFWIEAIEGAEFKWEEDIKSDDADKFLKQNAPALLLGYIRPLVSNLTAASPYSSYEIPFVSFVE